MSSIQKVYLNHLGIVSCLGNGKQENFAAFLNGKNSFFTESDEFTPNQTQTLGKVKTLLPQIPAHLKQFNCRNNQLSLEAILQIKPNIDEAINRYGSDRVAVIAASSTTGIKESEALFKTPISGKVNLPKIQEMGTVSDFIFQYLNLNSFHYTISTACSSSAKMFASAQRLLDSDLCDAVILVGADTLSYLTVQGFCSLEAVSKDPCVPFSVNRKGINLGEGAAAFLISKEPTGDSVFLAGYGESSDAHHMSAPDPQGKGAIIAVNNSLALANIQASDIHYINLHGTGTELNDSMEGKITHQIFGNKTPCSSSKSLTGHTLGASGIIEASFCWLLLSSANHDKKLPIHYWDNVQDPEIPPILLCQANMSFPSAKTLYTLSNSFAFGGNNGSIILGKTN
jgi:3-oxoacyl-[acyl-carrier-protein] synthase-1